MMEDTVKRIYVGLLFLSLLACEEKRETYVVKEQLLNEAVYASGEVFPATYQILKVGSPERILKILVKEGDFVRAGTPLILLSSSDLKGQLGILDYQLRLARQNTEESESVLRELSERIRIAKTKFRQDSLNAERYKDLALTKAVSQKEADQTKIQAEISKSEYLNLEQQYISKKSELTNQLLGVKKEIAVLRQQQEVRLLKSSIAGKVYNINVSEGDIIKSDEPILMSGSESSFKLELLIDERDINKISIGQKTYFETDAVPEKQFTATVSKIVPVLQKETRSFKVEAAVSSNQSFYPRSSVEANILIRENIKVPVIPFNYLTKGDTVNVMAGEQVKKKKIESGTRQGNWLEVKKGLKANEVIVKPGKL